MRVAVSDCAHIDEILPLALEHNVGIEIQEYVFPENIDRYDHMARDIGRKIREITLRGFHGPFSELVPASRDTKIQKVTRSRFQSAYELAKTVGAQHLILHTGYIPKTYPRESWIKNSVGFWVSFLSDKHGSMRLHLENVYDDDYSMVSELLNRVNEALQRDTLTACLDIGHVHSNSSKTLEEWIRGLGSQIRYVHLHSNDGIVDDHWGLWKGRIDIAHVLDLLVEYAPDSVWTIETIRTDIEKSVVWLREKGYM
jgi:sugar phosphate isomerase/epimerase